MGEDDMSTRLCGRTRTGHFRGVLTVVAKLFNIVLPDLTVFGQKDVQQARLVQRMIVDLAFPVSFHLGPIVRESDGLAMSSRNRYLDDVARDEATCLHEALVHARECFEGGERRATAAKTCARRSPSRVGEFRLGSHLADDGLSALSARPHSPL